MIVANRTTEEKKEGRNIYKHTRKSSCQKMYRFNDFFFFLLLNVAPKWPKSEFRFLMCERGFYACACVFGVCISVCGGRVSKFNDRRIY